MDSFSVFIAGAPSVVVSPKEANYDEGQRMVLRCQASGVPSPQIQWTKDGSVFYGDNIRVVADANIVFKQVIPGDSGKYRCIAFNSVGSDMDIVTVNIRETSKGLLKKI